MAILENRYKAKSQILLRLILAVPEFVRRFLSIILLILSIQILYFSSNNSSIISSMALEYSSYPIDLASRFYNSITQSINNFSEFIADFKDLRRKNIELKLELARMKETASYAEFLHIENQHLQKALKINSSIKIANIPSRVLSVATGPYGMSAILASGSGSGVEKGDVVISDSSIVGMIVEVAENYSRMALINDFSSRIPVFGSVSGTHAIVAGRNNNNPSLLYVLDGSSIQAGEVLISSGDGKNFPSGFKVARVKDISGRLITTSPEVSAARLRYVNILKQ